VAIFEMLADQTVILRLILEIRSETGSGRSIQVWTADKGIFREHIRSPPRFCLETCTPFSSY
jgi:hypothetical protein